MAEHDDRRMGDTLKQSFRPVNTALGRDLWPELLRRLDERPVRVPWYDWALAGSIAVMFLAFPRLILVLAYHL